jgi:glutathione-regulated potassium-efflux system ancillary protein KefC
MDLLRQALIFLAATVVAVPLFARLGLGSVLGYLAAGVVIGPYCLKAVAQVENVLHVAELGVVLLLFLIGLELQPARLWQLRRNVFGLGALQVVATSVVLGVAALLFGLGWRAALITGFGLSLSSTAFALQLLGEKKELATDHGQAAFGILLFQDLAVIPMLAILPLLGPMLGMSEAGKSGRPAWLGALQIVGVLAGVIVIGRFVVRRVFRVVAATRSQELFTATALLTALGTAAVVSRVGLSMALGAFLAGVLLADTEYRTELEADIEPFKGLLLGLFFIAVGMSVNLHLIASRPLVVAALVLGLVAVKGAVLFVIGWVRFRSVAPALSLAINISQGGEFAFVLFGLAVGLHLLQPGVSDLLVVVVTLSMAATPALSALYTRVVRPRLLAGRRREFDVAPEEDTPVIVAGFGRVGQVVGRVLRAERIPFTALDVSSEQIDFLKRFGNKVFYGDASRLDLLRAARADKAKVFVVAIDDVEASLRTVQTVLEHFPQLTIIARARNRAHAYRLLALGVTHFYRETFQASLELTVDVLEALGFDHDTAHMDVQRFREHDEQLVAEQFQYQRDDKKLIEIAMRARAELESLFEKDVADRKAS